MNKKEIKIINDKFNKLYEQSQATIIGKFILKFTECETINLIKKLGLKRSSRTIDVGCGIGRTLRMFRNNQFFNSIGIDNSKNAIRLCERNGLRRNKDVFLINAKKTPFSDNEFDLVFEEGLLEHFKNFQPFIDEMCRISKKYVVLIQPNKFSLAHKLMDRFTNDINIKEIPYEIHDFCEAFRINNFKLKSLKNGFLNIFWILVFERLGNKNVV